MGDLKPKIEQRILHQVLRALMLLSVALLQSSLAPTLWRFRIDWVLLLVVGWTLLKGFVPGLRWAIYGGLSLDFLGTMPVGSHLLALVLCVCAVALLAEPLDRDQPLLVQLCLLAAALIYGLALAAVLWATSDGAAPRDYLLVVVLPTALINTIAAIPTYAVLRRLARLGQPLVQA